MPQVLQIKCINKTDRYNPHERIQNVGGIEGGQRWKMTEQQAIAGIESQQFAFFVEVSGSRVAVIVAHHNGNKYLKTTADGEHPNNLLSLPECP